MLVSSYSSIFKFLSFPFLLVMLLKHGGGTIILIEMTSEQSSKLVSLSRKFCSGHFWGSCS